MNRLASILSSMLAVLLFGLLIVSPAEAQKTELRTWTSKSGKFSLKARMISGNDKMVELQREDGSFFEVEIEKLSDADQKFIRAQLSRKTKSNSSQDKSQGHSSGPMDYTQGIQIDCRQVESWQATPDPLAKQDLSKATQFVFENYYKKNAQKEFYLMDPSRTKLMFLHGTQTTGEKMTGHVFDLETGEQMGGDFQLGLVEPLAISPNLQNIMVTAINGFERRKLGWLQVSGGKIVDKLTWMPYPGSGGSNRPQEVSYVRFVGDDYLLTWGGRKFEIRNQYPVVACWDLKARQLKWWLPAAKPAVSGNAKVMVAATYDDKLVAIDLPSGKVLGARELQAIDPQVSMSPNGEYVAAFDDTNDRVQIVDVASGKTVNDFMTTHGMGQMFGWINDRQFLVKFLGSFTVMDVDYRGRIWNYKFSDAKQHAHAIDAMGRMWFFNSKHEEGTPGTMSSVSLPHAGLKTWMAAHRPESMLLLKPGSAINLRLSATAISSTPEQRDDYDRQMGDILRKEMETRGREKRTRPRIPIGPPTGPPTGPPFGPGKGGLPVGPTQRQHPNVRFSTVDVTAKAREIIERKLKHAGFTISPTATATLDLTFAPAQQLRPPHADRLPAQARNPGPNSIAYTGELNVNGNRAWLSGHRSIASQKPYDTTTPESIKYLERLSFGKYFSNVGQVSQNYSNVTKDGIVDRQYGQR
jgi:hypothetical protein